MQHFYFSHNMAFQPANLNLPTYTPGLSSAINTAGLNTNTGTGFQSAPASNQLYNAGTNTSMGGKITPVTSGANLASATGTSGNVNIGPPPAPGSSWGRAQGDVFNTVGDPLRGNPIDPNDELNQLSRIEEHGDLNPIQRQRLEQLRAPIRAAMAARTPPPVTAPPAAPVPQSTVAAKPVGSTAAPGSTGTGGGVAGQAFPATSQLGLGTKGLQIAGLAPQAVSAQMAPTLPKGQPTGISPEFVSRLAQSTGANTQQVPIVGGVIKAIDDWNKFQKDFRVGSWGLPELGITEKIQQGLSNMFPNAVQDTRTMEGGSSLLKPRTYEQELLRLPEYKGGNYGTQEEFMKGQIADINKQAIGTPQAITKSVLGAQGIQQTPIKNPLANPATLSGSIPAEQHPQAIQSFLSGQSPIETVASAIASPQALQTIGVMFNQAQQTGDTQTAQQLANLHSGVQQQLNFINQITQMVSALSAGFGTPNAPGVTEARTPMVQAGIGGALTTPSMAQATGGAAGQNVQMWTPQLPTAPTERNKPVFNPYMG